MANTTRRQKVALLVDGDPYAYQAAIRNEHADYWEDDGLAFAFTNVGAAVAEAVERIEQTAQQLEADKIIFCLSDPRGRYFRHDLGSYKQQRKLGVRPLALREVKEGIAARFKTIRKDGIEADDLLGILATDPAYLKGYKKIVVSIDKDLKTIPGYYFNPDKMEEPELRTQEDADRFFYAQCIAGDLTDGYTGAPGFGMETAFKLLDKSVGVELYDHELKAGPRKGETEQRRREIPVDHPWETVISCYKSVGLDETDALFNARMARILTADLWDKENEKPILWSPPHGSL